MQFSQKPAAVAFQYRAYRNESRHREAVRLFIFGCRAGGNAG
jgi:hypothetical protein